MSTQPLERFEPSCNDLLRLVFKHVDRSMLQEIADADYGADADKHLAQLLMIKRGHVPALMRWEPKEVLELVRWSEPEDPTWSPGSRGERGHWMRLFACTLLLRAAAKPANDGYFSGEDSTVIQLVDSAIRLGPNTSLAALKFLCWCLRSRSLVDWDRPFFAVAILMLTVSLAKCDTETAKFLISAMHSDQWAQSEMFVDCQKKKTWYKLIRGILIDSKNSSPDIRELGESLTPDSEQS